MPSEKPESCKTCTLYTSTEGPVWGEGPEDADIMIVGEAPGEDEGTALRPFVGGSGKILNKLLFQAGIDRNKIFVTNTVKCRPTAKGVSGDVINRVPTDHEIRSCARFLLMEIHKVNPNVIVAAGNIPMQTMTGSKKGILTTRSVPTPGSKRSDGKADHYKIIGALHPAYIMRQVDLWPAAVYDLARARLESSSPVISRRPWQRVIHARLSDVGDGLMRRIREPRLYGLRYYHHDLETTGLDPRRDTFRCIGLAAEADEVYVFDWTPDVVKFVGELHSDPTLITVGQNSEGFDIPFQEAKGFTFNGLTFDTLIGWHQLNAGLPKDLAFIGASVTDELAWKDDSMYRSGEDALQHGCAKDVHATARAFTDEVTEMHQLGQLGLYFNHIAPVQPVLRQMTRRGIKKDQRKAAAWHVVLTRKADEYEARLKKGLGDSNFNVDSPTQLMGLLYRRMGLPTQFKKTREGFRPTVDADALDALAAIVVKDSRYAVMAPLLKLVRSIRTLRKWDSTFVLCEQDENFFVHGHFSTARAANGRLNSYDPNMQNFPVEVREIFIPDTEDHIFVARDWSQIEWRVAMALSGDPAGLDALAAGRDAHKDAYSQAFETDYDTVTKAERDIAKAVNYGLLYGRGADSVSQGRAGHPEDYIPIERVTSYIDKFLRKFSGYGKMRFQVEQDVKKKNFVETAWGRRRYWYTTRNMPEAYNFPISGTAAHMMYEAIVEVNAQLPVGASLRLTVHDELVLMSTKDQKTLQAAIDCSKDVMERAFPQVTERSLYPDVLRHYYPNGWNCPSDCHIGETWKACKGKDEDLPREMELRKLLGVNVR